MAHTQLDHDFLSSKHSLIHKITGELLDELQAGKLSQSAGQQLAIEVLEGKDGLRSNEELITFLKKISSEYPFLRKLHKDFQSSILQSNTAKELKKEDIAKLEQIQDQLVKLSGSA
jgi:hypothetical protein